MADITKLGPGCENDGERGERGRRGHRGATGPTGPAAATASSALKFSGVVAPSDSVVPVVSFLADFGAGLGLGNVLTTPPSYPAPVPLTLVNFATNILDGIALPADTLLVFDLLKNLLPVPGFSITYGPGETGVKTVLAGPIDFAIGDVFDVRASATGVFEVGLGASATVGVE
jgi:hypothetical protein